MAVTTSVEGFGWVRGGSLKPVADRGSTYLELGVRVVQNVRRETCPLGRCRGGKLVKVPAGGFIDIGVGVCVRRSVSVGEKGEFVLGDTCGR